MQQAKRLPGEQIVGDAGLAQTGAGHQAEQQLLADFLVPLLLVFFLLGELIALGNDLRHHALELVHLDRLQQIADRLGGHRLFGKLKLPVSAENQNAHIRVFLKRMPRQFQPVHLGHLYIGEQDVDGMGAHIFSRWSPGQPPTETCTFQ